MLLRVKKVKRTAQLPTKGSAGAGGYDLYAHKVVGGPYQETGEIVTVDTGLCFEIPEGYMLHIIPRSSIAKTGWMLANSIGLIDSDYRGEVSLKFVPIPAEADVYVYRAGDSISTDAFLNYTSFPYQKGDRVAQCYLVPCIDMEFKSVRELSKTVRGDGGFGSTNK